MTARAKEVLINSINHYKSVNAEQKEACIEVVKDKLSLHENGVKTIGYGLDGDFVQAGRVFLRLTTKQRKNVFNRTNKLLFRKG